MAASGLWGGQATFLPVVPTGSSSGDRRQPCPNSKGLCLVPQAAGALPNGGFFSPLQARRQFQSQLADLQQLPDILKITEAKLAECQDQLQGYERKNIDLTAIISDLRSRVRDWQKGSHELARAGARLPR